MLCSILPFRRKDAMIFDRIEEHLWRWARWMYAGKTMHLRHRSKAAGGFADASSDFDTMVEAADIRCAEATDAAIDELPPTQRAAVHAKWLETNWSLPDEVLGAYYRVAVEAIGRGLDKRGIV